MTDDDRDLRQAFKALGVEASLPPFAQLTSPVSLDAARWRRRRHQAAFVLVVLAIPALLLRGRTDQTIDYDHFTALTGLDLSEVSWEAPSDFLLETPGRDLLRAVPLIDTRLP